MTGATRSKRLGRAGLWLALLTTTAAQAQESAPDKLNVSYAVDGAIVTAAVLGTVLVTWIPVDRSVRWQRHLLPFDKRLEGCTSASAARTSDILAVLDVMMPLGLMLGQQGMTEDNGKRMLVYGESVAVSLFFNGVIKYLVGRPRPYVYNDDPRVQVYAEREGKDSHLSFYSGHASTTFTASVAGAYLFAQATTDKKARATVWGFELALAGATASLRTRAGKHFYSDVIVGSLVGAAVGFAVPRLHGGPKVDLSAAEWVTIGSAPVVGAIIGQLLPARADTLEPLSAAVMLPWVTQRGGGLMLASVF